MARLSFILTIVAVTLAYVFAEELFSDRYDNINIDEILGNEKLRTQYYNCFMDIGPCVTADAKFFKGIIGEAMQTKCRRCTQKQKDNLDRMADWYTKYDLEKWNKFVQKTVQDAQKN